MTQKTPLKTSFELSLKPFKPVVFTVFLLIVLSLYYKDYTIIASGLLGTVFSYIGFYQLITTQRSILSEKKSSSFFMGLVFRLLIYAVPITLGLLLKTYFNFIIILVCLFNFQFSYIVIELIDNYVSYKKRIGNG